jgi:hypothetical protein
MAVAAVELEVYICSNLDLQGGNNVFKQQPSHIIIAMFSVCFSYYSIVLPIFCCGSMKHSHCNLKNLSPITTSEIKGVKQFKKSHATVPVR